MQLSFDEMIWSFNPPNEKRSTLIRFEQKAWYKYNGNLRVLSPPSHPPAEINEIRPYEGVVNHPCPLIIL